MIDKVDLRKVVDLTVGKSPFGTEESTMDGLSARLIESGEQTVPVVRPQRADLQLNSVAQVFDR